MEITEQCVVALTWVLKDTLGEELDVLDDPVEFLVGGDDLLGRIDQALQGHGVGAELSLHLEPEEAFGDYQDKLLFLEPRQLFPTDIEEGMTFEGTALPQGVNPDAPRDALYTVAQICWSRLTTKPVLEETEDYIESTRFSLVSQLGSALAGIRRNLRMQHYLHEYVA